jgi:hypothetical protein
MVALVSTNTILLARRSPWAVPVSFAISRLWWGNSSARREEVPLAGEVYALGSALGTALGLWIGHWG